MSTTPLFYMCSFNLGNFTYLYRCRIMDQYCCDHTCCFNQPENDAPQLFASWYFWSLIMVVLVVFGCIVISFALSGLKRKVDIESWSAFAGTAFNSLATTVIGKQGIIEPKLHYNNSSKPETQQQQQQQQQTNSTRRSSNPFWNTFSSSTFRGNEANAVEMGGGIATISKGVTLTEQQEQEEGTTATTSSPDSSSTAVTITTTTTSSSNSSKKKSSLSLGTSDWVEVQLTPLCPAYKSSWPGNANEQRIAASTQVFFPPGFINS